MAHLIPKLNTKRIVLASGSPRRKEILATLGLKFEVHVSDFDETLPHDAFKGGADYAVATAKHKALDVAAALARGTAASGSARPVGLLISADTVVEAPDGTILEKPADAEHALAMLSRLSGHQHQVHTGVVLVLPCEADPATGAPPFVRCFSATTDVTFDTLSEQELRAYIASGEPFGKAGAYGIQGLAGSFVKGINGCFFNVVGFPLHRFTREVLRLVEEGRLKLPVQ